MNVYLFTKKILKGATIGMPLHVAFYVEIYDKVILMNRKKCQRYSLAQEYQNIEKYMTVGKLLKFASKPEQPGLSSSIRLEVM